MHSMPSDLPKYGSGDSVKARTLNHLAEITKGTSVNSQGTGMHGHSTSTGSSYNLQVDLTRPPIWAMVTGARKKYPPGQYPSLEDPDCPPIAGQFDYCFPPYNPAKCPNYWFAHSWSELIEDYDISRHGSELFKVTQASNLPPYTQPLNNYNGNLETYERSCRAIAREYGDSGGLFGHINNLPLYEANNLLMPVGYVTQIYFGKGNYMICILPNNDVRGTNSILTSSDVFGFLPEASACCKEKLNILFPQTPLDQIEDKVDLYKKSVLCESQELVINKNHQLPL